MNINDLLKLAVERNASDLHLKVGSHPMARIDGGLMPMPELKRLMQEDTISMAYSIMNAKQKQRFKEELDLDLAYSVPGLGRFRCNIFQQRGVVGMVMRVIPSRIKRNEGVEAGSGHDLAPHFLPDDRIVFSSTRQSTSQGRQLNEGRIQLFAALAESGGDPAAVLHLYDPQLRNDEFKQISFNLSHDLDPTVLASGEILFSRWNNTAGNHISLFRLDPSGFELTPVFGFNSNEEGGVYTQPRELDDGRLVSVLRQPATLC